MYVQKGKFTMLVAVKWKECVSVFSNLLQKHFKYFKGLEHVCIKKYLKNTINI